MDCEREAAREWQEVGIPQEAKRSRVQTRTISFGYFERDNEAGAAWRNREPPTESFMLPKTFVPSAVEQPHRGRARPNETGTRIPELESISQQTNTAIHPELEHSHRGTTNIHLSIWGSEKDAAKAKSLITEWVKTYVLDTNSHKPWAKVNSVGKPEQRNRYEAKIKEEEEKEQYRRDPPIDAIFTAIATFEWDAEYDTPEQVLGAHLEACDPLRTEFSCYIVSVPHQKALKAMGSDAVKVKTAVRLLRGIFFQAVARGRASNTTPVYLFHPLTHDSLSSSIMYRSLHPPSTTSPFVEDQTALGAQPYLQFEDISTSELALREKRARQVPTENVKRWQKALGETLSTVKYFRGNLHMMATFGTFLLHRHKANVHDYEEFKAMMEEDQVEGVVKTICTGLTDRILSTICQHPKTHNIENPAVKAIPPPTYSAYFMVRHKKEMPDVQLDVYLEHDISNNRVDCLSRKWSRHIYGLHHQVKLLDVNLVDLESDSDAWSLGITAMESVNIVKTPELEKFAAGVSLDTNFIHSSNQNERFVTYKAIPGIILDKVGQKKHWTVEYNHSGYLIDICEVQEFLLRNPSSKTPDQYSLVAGPNEWRVSVYRKDWDATLAETATLQIGRGIATRNLNLNKFFPSHRESEGQSGVSEFLEILKDVAKIIRGAG